MARPINELPTDELPVTPTNELPTHELPAGLAGQADMPGVPGAGLPGAGRARPLRSARSGFAGILAAMLVIMGLGMIVAQIVSGVHGQPGPGALGVGAHAAGAVAGICCYRLTRRRGLPGLLGFVALPLITVALLWFFWWSPF